MIPKDSSNPFQDLRSQNFFQTDDKEQSPEILEISQGERMTEEKKDERNETTVTQDDDRR